MSSSPGSPTGNGRLDASRIYVSVLWIGLPTWMLLASVIRHNVDQMVVSVGPYKFQSSAQRGMSSDARSAGIASPPHKAVNRGVPVHPAASIRRQVVGVACSIV